MDLINNTSVIIVTHNHFKFIQNCLDSINHEEIQIIVVDNDSKDKTVDLIEKSFSEVKIIKNMNNGYGAGVNLGVKNSNRKYVLILNPDTKLEKNSIEELLKPLNGNDKLITTPKILCYDGSRINTCGFIPHFTGLAFTRGLGLPPNKLKKPKFVNGVSGACFAITRENYWELNGFNEDFFLYMEDTEFSWKARSQGFRIWYVPSSIVYHDYTLEVNPKKIYYLEKGRYLILRQYLTPIKFFTILPSIFMTEVLTCGYSILMGFEGVKFKFKAVKDARKIKIQKNSNGFDIIKSMDFEIPYDQLSLNRADRTLRKLANKIYKVNYKIIN